MLDYTTPAPAVATDDTSMPAFENSAIARCCAAYITARDESLKQGNGRGVSEFEGCEAYCNSMPPLVGSRNIRDFIACTAYGMLIGTILSDKGAKLLYAAQVAHSMSRKLGDRKQFASHLQKVHLRRESKVKKTRSSKGSAKQRATKK